MKVYKFLVGLITSLLLATSGHSQTLITNGLEAYYTFQDNASDLSGRGNNGVPMGDVVYSSVPVAALETAPANGYVTIPDSTSLDSTNELTVSICFQFASVNGQNSIFEKNNGFMLYYTGSAFRPHVWTANGWQYADYGFTPVPGQWVHFAFTYSPSNGLIPYINGLAVSGSPGPGAGLIPDPGTDPLYIGAAFRDGSWPVFNGEVSSFTVYNRELPPAEIAELYTNETALVAGSLIPEVVSQPTALILTNGTPAVFQVGGAAGAPFTYQWQFDGADIAGATNAIFEIPEAGQTNAGYYDAILANSYGSVTSSIVALDAVSLGAPSAYVNSNLVVLADTVVGDATVSLEPGFTNGLVLYTLDGSDPEDGDGMVYEQPFIVSNSITLRAVSYSADFSQSAEMLPLALQIVPGFEITTGVAGNGVVDFSPVAKAFASNSVVTLTAVAGQDWAFDHWQGAVTSYVNPLPLTVSSNLAEQAVFTQIAYPLTLSTTGGGTVFATGMSTDGINFVTNSVVSLNASNSPGWTFLGWQGAITTAANPASLVITQATAAQAIFGTEVVTNPVGGGQIVLSTQNLIAYGSNVTVSAVANNGDYFVSWDGVVTGTNTPASAPITNALSAVDALFLPLPANKFSLSVAVLGNGAVSVSPQKNYYDPGEVVTLTALPSGPATIFYGWVGGNNYTNTTTTVTMETNLVVYANFAALPAISTAQATPLLSSGVWVGTEMTSGGFGYTNTPVVTLVGGGGSGATAVAIMQGGVVVGVSITSGGTGYTNAPQIIIEPPVIIPPWLALAPASSLAFSNLTVGTSYLLQEFVNRSWTNLPQGITATNSVMPLWVNGVAGYDSYRVVALPLPLQATAAPITDYGYVVFAAVTEGGSGYFTAPGVTILGGGGSGASATAVVSNGVVTAVNITNPGSGYTNIPTIRIAAPPTPVEYGSVQPGVVLSSVTFMTNQLYQMEHAPQINGPWISAGDGAFISTNLLRNDYLLITNNLGYYRLEYLP